MVDDQRLLRAAVVVVVVVVVAVVAAVVAVVAVAAVGIQVVTVGHVISPTIAKAIVIV